MDKRTQITELQDPDDTPLHTIAVVLQVINTGIELMTDSRRRSLPLNARQRRKLYKSNKTVPFKLP